ncbi:hypothetical protein V6N11_008591 [Hibiscus sabdariffa]
MMWFQEFLFRIWQQACSWVISCQYLVWIPIISPLEISIIRAIIMSQNPALSAPFMLHPVVPFMNTEGKLITPIFYEEMGSENEDSPLVHADGLKRPRIFANAKALFPTGV